MNDDKFNGLTFRAINEEDLTYLEHNQIHNALNLAYKDRTKNFLKKTYGHCEPYKRILCFENDLLIGHTAIFMPTTFLPKLTIIGGIGMTLSLKKGCGIGHELRKRAAKECAALKLPFAVGRVKNEAWVKKNLNDIVVDFLDLPLVGKTTASHDWETLAIYSCQQEVKSEIAYIKQQKQLVIEGEVF